MLKRYQYTLLLLALLLSACASDFDKAMKSGDKALRYKVGVAYYKAGKYDKATQLLESIEKAYARTPQAQRLLYFIADAHFKSKDYPLASYYFNSFYKRFPKSEKAENAAYMAALCYDVQSPYFELDQTLTRKAIDVYQRFIDAYPSSDKAVKADARIRTLTKKLERKEFAIAKRYLKTMNYQAAKVAIGNFLDDYPDTALRQEAMESLFEASYKLAMNSVFKLREERLVEARTAYRLLIKAFPDTAVRERADGQKRQIDAALVKVRKQKAALREAKKDLSKS